MPWTVDLGNVADHARPLARWINRTLWDWSPWHLRYSLAASREGCDKYKYRNAMLNLRLAGMVKVMDDMIEDHMKPLRESVERHASYAGFDLFSDPIMRQGYGIRVVIPRLEAYLSMSTRTIPPEFLEEHVRRLGSWVGVKLAEQGVREFTKAGLIKVPKEKKEEDMVNA